MSKLGDGLVTLRRRENQELETARAQWLNEREAQERTEAAASLAAGADHCEKRDCFRPAETGKSICRVHRLAALL